MICCAFCISQIYTDSYFIIRTRVDDDHLHHLLCKGSDSPQPESEAIVLAVLYLCYLIFQLVTHKVRWP